MLKKIEAEKMVRENILPFWQNMIDRENGGFFGEADFYGIINKKADKGGILNSRILWTFSAAYNLFKDETYKSCAAHARDFLLKAFYDNEYGGLYWLVDFKGNPLQNRKQFYNLAFGIYALSEYYLTFLDPSSLETAMSLFEALEKYGFDTLNGGYIEARKQNWDNIDDFRLSEKDLNCPKSMNTNLHVLEAYTTLLRAVKKNAADGNDRVKKALKCLLRLTLDKIVNRAFHFELFFDMEWRSLSKEVSFGHDIEGSWLMCEAALAIEDESLISETKDTALKIADIILKEVLCNKNGIIENGEKIEWWPQAEAVVGFYNAYELSGHQKYLDAANGIWLYIKNYFADNGCGEWFNELFTDNSPDNNMPKAGFWKCPYHNSRACFEIIKRSEI